jgi:hypothetical protein
MPEVTNPETIKMLNALAARQNAPARPAQPSNAQPFGEPQPIIATPPKPEKPEKPTETFRPLSEEEVIARGLDPKGVYEIGSVSQSVRVVQTPKEGKGALDPKTAEGQRLIAQGILKSVGVDPASGVDPVSEMIRKSTSGGLQQAAAGAVGFLTGQPTPGMEEIGRLRAIGADMTLQMAGGSLGSGMSNADREFISDRMGDVANPAKTAGERLAAWNEVKKRLASVSGAEMGKAPAEAAAAPNIAPPIQVAQGVKFSTEQDLANATALNRLWAGGASIGQMNDLSVQLTGAPLSAESIKYLQDNINNRNLPAVSPASSGNQEAPGAVSEIAAGLGGGLLRGTTANLAEELVNVVDPATAAKLQAALEYGQQQAPGSSLIGELGGGIVSPLSRLGGTFSNPITREAASGAIYGTLYGAGEADPNVGLMDRLPGAFTGALTGTAGGAIGGKIAQSMGGGAASQQALQAAERANIPVMASDVVPPETFIGKAVQQAGERIPFAGTGSLRQTQQAARTDAVTELLTDYGVNDPTLAQKVASSLTQTRKAQIDKYTTMKREVIEPLASAGAVPVTGATRAIDDEITRLERISPEGFAPVVSILRRWKSDLAGKSLDDIEVLRRQVGEEFAAPELAKVSGEAQRSLNRIYKPLREDMGAFIKANGAPKDYVKWQVANKRLAEGMEELGKSALKTALRDAEQTPEAVWRLLHSNKPSDVAALYRNLGPQGKAAARSAVLDKAFRDAVGDAGTIDEITPEKFLTAMKNNGAQVRIFFSGEEADRVTGLIKALKLTSRAGQANVMTQSGQQAVPILGAASLTGAVGALLGDAATGGAVAAGTVGLAGSIGGLARLLESDPVRNALIAMQKAKPIDQNKAAQGVVSAIRAASAQLGGNLPSSAPQPTTEPTQ